MQFRAEGLCSQRDAAIVLGGLRFGWSVGNWLISDPPEPACIRWRDLRKNRRLEVLKAAIGFALLGVLYVGFMPIVLIINNAADAITFQEAAVERYWQALAPTMGLTVFVSFLPTVLHAIFRNFFTIKSEMYAQHDLQRWYFWWQVMFVLIVEAVGPSVVGFVKFLIDEPLGIFQVLATKMPTATHFYMNFLVLSWLQETFHSIRIAPLFKFCMFRVLYSDEEARDMAEPEDQDYYGKGARAARLTIFLLIGIMFSTLSPLMPILCLILFVIIRTVYGYLMVFAENKKVDLGGVFWVSMLHHVQYGVWLYCVMMIGILAVRPYSVWPVCVAACSLPFSIWSFQTFKDDFLWERLPFNEIAHANFKSAADSGDVYVQPEMLETVEEARGSTAKTPRASSCAAQ
eukprot:TRINITY_DN34125_c0_g1_i1.p1 TRINITY_DN34125_c0_g1~~TRINITY_DN34125_c0_g1_i1.p1  ORF type:complete len:402 (-),score=66.31 TRINITY_DN34125_c0_g1_i1:77-1282(-)